MTRQYLTYTRLYDKIGNNKIDPQALMNYRWGEVFNFRETWACGASINDPRFIAVIDHEGKEDNITDMISKDGLFEFELITKDKAEEKMNFWYGEGNWEFEDNNVFKDLRAVEDL